MEKLQNRKYIQFFLVAMIIVGLLLVSKAFLNDNQKLVSEFSNSYPKEKKADGTIRVVDLVAAPSTVNISEKIALNVWSYNGKVPGPEIRLRLGDTLKINFTNNLPQETTIHFHGIRVPNAMDGVPGVTQDPIKPGGTFVYEFIPKDPGTYWYHPHVRGSEQVERGLFGTIIVENPVEPKYDRDEVIVLDDWRLDQTGQIDSAFNTRGDLAHDGRWGNLITVNASTNFSLNVNPGERLRLRFVNTSNGRVYALDFLDLKAQAFAVDGMLAKTPFNAQGFELAPGNRLDVDILVPLTSRSQPYVIRDTFTRESNALFTIVPSDKPIEPKNFTTPVASTFPEWKNASSLPIDKEYVLNARAGGMYGIEWTINGKAHPDYETIELKYAIFNKVRITNKSARIHPMHLHGQFFKVIARNGVSVDESYWRDTVLVHPRETVDIGLVPLDKGKWANHCHILEHAEAGMMSIVEVK